jgi:hypothetical protein
VPRGGGVIVASRALVRCSVVTAAAAGPAAGAASRRQQHRECAFDSRSALSMHLHVSCFAVFALQHFKSEQHEHIMKLT